MASRWDPWRGCHKYSEGCKFCYIHKGDAKRGINTDDIVKTPRFDAPVAKNKKNEYKMKPDQLIYLCFASDFLLEDADPWRDECWEIIKERSDLHFLFLTKRIDRFEKCIPKDWKDGYENVTVSCTVENQKCADYRLSIFSELPVKHKNISCQPLIEEINIEKYLNNIDYVTVGGESDKNARVFDFKWVLSLRNQCINKNVKFNFRQCGTNFLKDGKISVINVMKLCSTARSFELDT